MIKANKVIEDVDSWIKHLECAYGDTEVGMNCLVKEWEELKKTFMQ